MIVDKVMMTVAACLPALLGLCCFLIGLAFTVEKIQEIYP